MGVFVQGRFGCAKRITRAYEAGTAENGGNLREESIVNE